MRCHNDHTGIQTSGHDSMSRAERELRASMPLDLGDGLQLRFATPNDIDPVVDHFQQVWGQEAMGIWLRDLMEGRHPNVAHHDFALVEDKTTGRIVSSMDLISQTWSYGGIRFRCGQLENVVTSHDYRRRGLVRRQFEVLHQLSAARGETMQVIWGMPWYYRQFGYEYAMYDEWGRGWRIHAAQIPQLAEADEEPFVLRTIQEKDLTLVRKLYESGTKRGIFAAVKEQRDWDFYFRGYSPGAMKQFSWHVICNVDGEPVGFLTLHDSPWWQFVDKLELAPGYSYLQVMPSVLRQLQRIVPEHTPIAHPELGRSAVELFLPTDHPVGPALPTQPVTTHPTTRVWYIRIPDVIVFLRHIRPALEANLVGTEAEGYSGELNISCFRWGVHICFESGRITAIDPWSTEDLGHRPTFPDLTLLQLICGLRRCSDLMTAFPDCVINDTDARLLDALFPSFDGGLWLGN